jgi:hypothetical protein
MMRKKSLLLLHCSCYLNKLASMQLQSKTAFEEVASVPADQAQLLPDSLLAVVARDAAFYNFLEGELYDPSLAPDIAFSEGRHISFGSYNLPEEELSLEDWNSSEATALECDDMATATLKHALIIAVGDGSHSTPVATPVPMALGISNTQRGASSSTAAAGLPPALNAYDHQGDDVRLLATHNQVWLPNASKADDDVTAAAAAACTQTRKRSHAYSIATTSAASPLTSKHANNKKQKTKPQQQKKEDLRTITQFMKALQLSQLCAPAEASEIKLHFCNLQKGYLRSDLAYLLREKLAGKGSDDYVLFLQHLPIGNHRNYKKGQGKNLRKEAYYEVALTGIDNSILKDFKPDADSTAAFAMTHANGTYTDHMVCDISKQQDADTGMYYLRFTPRAGGHWALGTALWTVKKCFRRGTLHGSIKIGSSVYTFDEGFVTESYSRGTKAKATEHTFPAEQQH